MIMKKSPTLDVAEMTKKTELMPLCQRCGHDESKHKQPDSFTFAKSNFSSGGGYSAPIKARTACTAGWKPMDGFDSLCLCIGFVKSGECCCQFAEILGVHLHPSCPSFHVKNNS